MGVPLSSLPAAKLRVGLSAVALNCIKQESFLPLGR